MLAVTDPAKIYDAFANQYRGYSEKRSKYIAGVDQLILLDTKEMGKSSISAFDFGAGDGVRGKKLAEKMKVQLLVQGDISQKMLKKCEALEPGSTYQLEVWDLSDLDWIKKEKRFDLILCLWNVLGHIPSQSERIDSMKRLKGMLKPGGRILFDVNNRHYRGYGKIRVQFRRLLDAFLPNEKRGDASFVWDIDGKKYPAYGHLFTKSEVIEILLSAGLEDYSWKTVDYATGKVSSRVTGGQLYFNAGAKA